MGVKIVAKKTECVLWQKLDDFNDFRDKIGEKNISSLDKSVLTWPPLLCVCDGCEKGVFGGAPGE